MSSFYFYVQDDLGAQFAKDLVLGSAEDFWRRITLYLTQREDVPSHGPNLQHAKVSLDLMILNNYLGDCYRANLGKPELSEFKETIKNIFEYLYL
jgi:hypothetical protein